MLAMSDVHSQRPIAVLWRLAWDHNQLACAVYGSGSGMELRLEANGGTIMSEPFDLQPRSVARTQALRASLLRRGWQHAPSECQHAPAEAPT
jgi:hypothetical protein